MPPSPGLATTLLGAGTRGASLSAGELSGVFGGVASVQPRRAAEASLGAGPTARRQPAVHLRHGARPHGVHHSHRQGIQWMLVENEIDLRQAKWMVLDAAAKADRGEPYRTESAIAKLVASEASGRVVDRSMQIHGGLGVAKDLPLERWYRELRIRRVGEGPSEVQKHVIARDILGASLR